MITYYRDPTVLVTSAYVQVEGRAWRLSELEYVWHREAPPTWRVRGRTASRGLLNTAMILVGILGFVLLIAFLAAGYTEATSVGGVPRSTLLLLAVVLILIGVGVPVWEWALHRVDESYDKGDAIYEIWAQVDGRSVLVLRLADLTRFGQIYRALERALGG
ncbi:DUF6232 family protein [Hamadaea tsunoensis]|uniref:DUF6232 family protein n=1 Tax=Hamadaea tsunoensis TaxID=53368 RepID=UPI0004187457|nr:DUF6232 family protein [Hamadaea tsunoensis]